MSKEEIEDIRKRVIRLVDEFDYPLTLEQLFKMIKRQIPKLESPVIYEVIKEVAHNGDLPPGKYIILSRVVSAPVVENATIPQFTSTSTTTDWEHFTGSDSTTFPVDVVPNIVIEEKQEDEMEVRNIMSEEMWAKIYEKVQKILGDVYYSEEFKGFLEDLPQKALDILTDEEAMSGRDLAKKLGLDLEKRAHWLALLVIYDQIKPYIVKNENIL